VSFLELCYEFEVLTSPPGKRRIAWLYAEFLYSIGAIPRRSFERMSGYSIEDETSEATVRISFHFISYNAKGPLLIVLATD
jgi:VanZ family protein